MYDLFDTTTADLHAGGPRPDLDDVVVGEPCQIEAHYAAPDDGDILGMFAELAKLAEQQWMMDKFYTPPPSYDSVEAFAHYAVIRAHNPETQSTGNVATSNMFCRYGYWLYTRNLHLTKMDCFRAMQEMGYARGKTAWYKWLERNADTANTERTRFAAPSMARAA